MQFDKLTVSLFIHTKKILVTDRKFTLLFRSDNINKFFFGLLLQCCSFDGLKYSQEVGVTNVQKGESVIGGEVVRNGRQISFDVIANVRKVYDLATKELVVVYRY